MQKACVEKSDGSRKSWIAYEVPSLLKCDGDHHCRAKAGLVLHVSLSWWSEEQRRIQEGEQTLGTERDCCCKDEPNLLHQPGNRGRKLGGE